MEDYHFKCGHLRMRYRAWACPDCHQPPAVSFDPSRQEFKISCCGYSLENENLAVVFGLWNDFVQEKFAEMEDEEKTLDGIVSKCPRCGSAMKKNIDANGTLSIKCGSGKRCICLASKDNARLFDILRNADWRAIAEEVKSCPECGGDEVEIWFDGNKFWIHCTHTRCWKRGIARGETLEEVRAQWKEIVGDKQNVENVDAVKGIARNVEKMEDKKEKDANDYSAEYQLKTPAERSRDKISSVVENLREMLLAKNKNYGNSAFQAPALLPDLPAEKAIFVRMSDKVARLAQLTSGEKDRVGESIEDTLYDLAGYCVLAIIAMRK